METLHLKSRAPYFYPDNRTSGSMSGRVETEHGRDIEAPAAERVGNR